METTMTSLSLSDQDILAVIDECLEHLRVRVQIGLARRGFTDYSFVVQMRLAVCSVVNDPMARSQKSCRPSFRSIFRMGSGGSTYGNAAMW